MATPALFLSPFINDVSSHLTVWRGFSSPAMWAELRVPEGGTGPVAKTKQTEGGHHQEPLRLETG